MLTIGGVSLGEIPRIVLSVGERVPRLERSLRAGVSLLEARIDWLARLDPSGVITTLRRLKRQGIPLIGTIRSRNEGGRARLSDSQRARLYAATLPWVDALDIELRDHARLASLVREAHRRGVVVIGSFHEMTGTPDERSLDAMIARATHAGSDMVKLAALAHRPDDLVGLLRVMLRHRATTPLTVIAMGPVGAISRLVFPVLGSLLTYTSAQPAFGQLPLRVLVRHLRYYCPAFERFVVGRRSRRHV